MASCFILSYKSRLIHAELDQPVFHDLSNLQIEYLQNIHLIRGNHEAADINAVFGFRIECIERLVFLLTLSLSLPLSFFFLKKESQCGLYCCNLCSLFFQKGERDGIWAWHRFNQLFNWLPLAALVEKKIVCMHGGIGRSINYVEQIENLQRPVAMEAGSVVLMDLLWSAKALTFSPYLVTAYIQNI